MMHRAYSLYAGNASGRHIGVCLKQRPGNDFAESHRQALLPEPGQRAFYKACCRLITEEIGKESNTKAKNGRLQRLQEHFLNLPVQHLAYKADTRIITTWIAGWIGRRISKQPSQDAGKLTEENKVKTSLAIPEWDDRATKG